MCALQWAIMLIMNVSFKTLKYWAPWILSVSLKSFVKRSSRGVLRNVRSWRRSAWTCPAYAAIESKGRVAARSRRNHVHRSAETKGQNLGFQASDPSKEGAEHKRVE